MSETYRCRCLERTLIRGCYCGHNPDAGENVRRVKDMTAHVTDVLTDYVYRERPQVRRRAIWRDKMNRWNGNFSRLPSSR
jgi:hypothetical protein